MVHIGDDSATDIFPKNIVGAVAGLVGFGGAMGGVVFGQVVGYLLDSSYGWGLVFALAGSFYVVAFMIICLAIPSIAPLRLGSGKPVAAISGFDGGLRK